MKNKPWNNTTVEEGLWTDIGKNNIVKDKLLPGLDLVYENYHDLYCLVYYNNTIVIWLIIVGDIDQLSI